MVSQIDEKLFNVTSSVDSNYRYTVFIKDDYEFCDCPAGQCGSFCKHICAVHLNGYSTVNCPVLTTTDRIQLGILAVGEEFDYSFFNKMNKEHEDHIIQEQLNLTEARSEFISSMNEGNEACNSSFQKTSTSEVDATLGVIIDSEIQKFQANMDNIKCLVEKNKNDKFVIKNFKNINNYLSRITSVEQLSEFSKHLVRKRHGKIIGTQPTSRSRRKSTISSGAKRIQAGRPSKTEANVQVKRKKKRCLAINIDENTPNAKTH